MTQSLLPRSALATALALFAGFTIVQAAPAQGSELVSRCDASVELHAASRLQRRSAWRKRRLARCRAGCNGDGPRCGWARDHQPRLVHGRGQRTLLPEADCAADVLGPGSHAKCGNAAGRFLWTWTGRVHRLPVGSAVGRQRARHELLLPMPFRRHARITITNEGTQPVGKFYFNIDYRTGKATADANALYFHAQYRQAQPTPGWTNGCSGNGDPRSDRKTNLDGKDNYVWLDARGRGHFVGVTMSVLQNQDGWWGEGDDMFFVDGASTPTIAGTGAEDYFLGAWGFGDKPFAYQLYGAPVNGAMLAGGRSSVYRFHLDSPLPFTKSFKATIEHSSANHRSDNFYSVAYWYQADPHALFPPLPPVDHRLPRSNQLEVPGNADAAACQARP
jgi:hypothetical protein